MYVLEFHAIIHKLLPPHFAPSSFHSLSPLTTLHSFHSLTLPSISLISPHTSTLPQHSPPSLTPPPTHFSPLPSPLAPIFDQDNPVTSSGIASPNIPVILPHTFKTCPSVIPCIWFHAMCKWPHPVSMPILNCVRNLRRGLSLQFQIVRRMAYSTEERGALYSQDYCLYFSELYWYLSESVFSNFSLGMAVSEQLSSGGQTMHLLLQSHRILSAVLGLMVR